MFISDVPWLSVWIVKFILVVLLDCKISWIVFLKCQINGCLLEWLDSSIIFLGRWGSLRSWPSAGDVERQGWIWNFIVTMILTVRIDIKRTEQLETRNLGCTQYIGILIDWLIHMNMCLILVVCWLFLVQFKLEIMSMFCLQILQPGVSCKRLEKPQTPLQLL